METNLEDCRHTLQKILFVVDAGIASPDKSDLALGAVVDIAEAALKAIDETLEASASAARTENGTSSDQSPP